MAKAKQLPSGAWRVRVYKGKDANGKAVYESITRPTRKEAEHAALAVQLHHKDVARDSSNMTLHEAERSYIDSRKSNISPATLAGYEKICRLYFSTLLEIPLNRITQQMIQKEIDAMSKRLASKTVANAHGFLNAVFKEYHPNFTITTKLPKKEKFIPNIPGVTDIPKIFEIVKGTEIEVPVHLAIWLGLRVSEIRALRFVNVKDDAIVIDSAIVDANGESVEKGTKSFAGTRVIPAPARLIQMIRALPHDSEQDHVTPLSGQSIYKRFTRLLEKHNLPHMRFHDLRHANASVMLMLGIPDKYAMERLGHATNSTLKNVYQHTMVKEKIEIASRIDSYFEELTPDD